MERTMEEKRQRTEFLVDRLVKLLLEETATQIKKLVVHRSPDDDCWLCLYMALKFIKKTANAEIVFVNSGQTLPDSGNDPSILHLDTGGGENDQHNKGFYYTSSAQLLADKLELSDDPGLKPLLANATMVDNIAPLPSTNIHFIIEGYPQMFKREDRTVDWQKVRERVFELFDIIYNLETRKALSRKSLEEHGEWTTLANGLKVALLIWHPECREAAFEKGAAVVIWTTKRGENHFYTGVQVNRNYPLYLDNTWKALQNTEALARRVPVEKVRCWYLHDSLKLILNGSRTYKPTEEEYTKLVPRQITGLVLRTLSGIPRDIVSRWIA